MQGIFQKNKLLHRIEFDNMLIYVQIFVANHHIYMTLFCLQGRDGGGEGRAPLRQPSGALPRHRSGVPARAGEGSLLGRETLPGVHRGGSRDEGQKLPHAEGVREAARGKDFKQ